MHKRYKFDQKVKMIITDSVLISLPPYPIQNVRTETTSISNSPAFIDIKIIIYTRQRAKNHKKKKRRWKMNLKPSI